MIILNIFAFLALIPLTLILIIIFNIYISNVLYLLTIAVFFGMYSLICGLMFSSLHVALMVFGFLAAGYTLYMLLLAKKSKASHSKKIALHGTLAHKHLSIKMFMQMGVLRLLKLLPNSINNRLSNKIGFKTSVSALLDIFFMHAKGTKLEIKNAATSVYLATHNQASEKIPAQSSNIKFLKVLVTDDQNTKVNINIPLNLAEASLKLIPREKFENMDFEMEKLLKFISEGTDGELINLQTEQQGRNMNIQVSIG